MRSGRKGSSSACRSGTANCSSVLPTLTPRCRRSQLSGRRTRTFCLPLARSTWRRVRPGRHARPARQHPRRLRPKPIYRPPLPRRRPPPSPPSPRHRSWKRLPRSGPSPAFQSRLPPSRPSPHVLSWMRPPPSPPFPHFRSWKRLPPPPPLRARLPLSDALRPRNPSCRSCYPARNCVAQPIAGAPMRLPRPRREARRCCRCWSRCWWPSWRRRSRTPAPRSRPSGSTCCAPHRTRLLRPRSSDACGRTGASSATGAPLPTSASATVISVVSTISTPPPPSDLQSPAYAHENG